MRIGPLTVKALSKLPSALGCEPQPPPIAAARITAAKPRRFRDGIIIILRSSRASIGPRRQPFLSKIYEEAQPEVPWRAPAEARSWRGQELYPYRNRTFRRELS